MSRSRLPFPTRLAIAHALIARGAPAAPTHVVDQLAAAGAETRVLHDQLAAVLPLLAPDRNWRQRIDAAPSDAVRAYLLAAILDCMAVCIHLHKGGLQPAFVQLPLRRTDCCRCVGTVRRPPPEESDRCDVCGAPEVLAFHPFAMRQGPALVVGDACPDCAGVLGIWREVAS